MHYFDILLFEIDRSLYYFLKTVYDVTDKNSIYHMRSWYDEFDSDKPSMPNVLVGTKADLPVSVLYLLWYLFINSDVSCPLAVYIMHTVLPTTVQAVHIHIYMYDEA